MFVSRICQKWSPRKLTVDATRTGVYVVLCGDTAVADCQGTLYGMRARGRAGRPGCFVPNARSDVVQILSQWQRATGVMRERRIA